ncbi:MAG: NUDIX hydrolase [Woeseiaceae bacterium]|nr:NUDIX hydrolase [Woeseiaceae bacterium]
MSDTAEARPSSTVILARATENEPELLMVKRHASSSFGGAWVFPGGVLDADDEAAAARCGALSAEAANETLAVDAGGLAYYSAAIRELFEETGILLADDETPDAPALRSSLLDGGRPWAEVVAERDIKLSLSALCYVSYWITPRTLPKRYSTRFFIAEYEGRTEPEACGGEVLDCRWLSARHALELADEGRIELHFPTRITLQGLAGHKTIQALMQWARCQANRGVPCIFPELPEERAVLEAVARGGQQA